MAASTKANENRRTHIDEPDRTDTNRTDTNRTDTNRTDTNRTDNHLHTATSDTPASPSTEDAVSDKATNRTINASDRTTRTADHTAEHEASATVDVDKADVDKADVNKQLVHRVEESAQSLRHAAESVENRGLKLLLKVMAQERVSMHNALRQTSGYRSLDPFDPEEKSSATSLQEGLQELQSSMAVKRQGRENVALNYLLDEEDALIEAYTAAIDDTPAGATHDLLTAQRAHVAQFATRLRAVDVGLEPIIARVFDTRVEGESAVTRLRERGLDASQIDTASIERVAHPALHTTETTVTAKSSPQQTMIAGALVGALCGGVFGLALAAFVWLSPQFVGWVTVGPWQLLIGSIIAGAFGGTVFGFFIGQNQKEIDQSVTADSLINGEILVVAYPKTSQIAMVEDVLEIRHARELNR